MATRSTSSERKVRRLIDDDLVAHPELLANFGIANGPLIASEGGFQSIEERCFSILGKFGAQLREHALEQRERPAALEKFFGS